MLVRDVKKIAKQVTRNLLENLGDDDGPEIWPRFMDVKTTALYIDKSETCVRNWIREGVLPTVKLGQLKNRSRQPVFVDRYALDKLFTTPN